MCGKYDVVCLCVHAISKLLSKLLYLGFIRDYTDCCICLYFGYYTKLLDYSYWINPIFHNSAYTEETAKEYLLSNKKYYDTTITYNRSK